ncbi:MAG: hypothetical protein ACYC6N_16875 [Pirellulaceae bacterium]
MTHKSWLDDKAETTLIDDYARDLGTFIEAMSDGNMDAEEVQQQEQRVVALMKQIEPQLDDKMHAQITKLLCEMSALSVMQVLYELCEARPKTTFQG